MRRFGHDRARPAEGRPPTGNATAPGRVVQAATSFAQLGRRLHRDAPVQRFSADAAPGPARDFSGIVGPGRPPAPRGLPAGLKGAVETRSGFAMDDVRVHRNSPRPAQLGALAYAQGRDIHLGPGQERHLPHEAWHVVQQKQGRVRPTLHLRGVGINDDAGLEREADRAAASRRTAAPAQDAPAQDAPSGGVAQRVISYARRYTSRKALLAALDTVVDDPAAREYFRTAVKQAEDETWSVTSGQVFDQLVAQARERGFKVSFGQPVSGGTSRHGPLLPTRPNATAVKDDPKAALSSFNTASCTLGRLTFWPSASPETEASTFNARQLDADVHAEDGLIEQFSDQHGKPSGKKLQGGKVNLTINNFFCSPSSTKKAPKANHCLGRIIKFKNAYGFKDFHVYFKNTYGDANAMDTSIDALKNAGIKVSNFSLDGTVPKFTNPKLDPQSEDETDAFEPKTPEGRKRSARKQETDDAVRGRRKKSKGDIQDEDKSSGKKASSSRSRTSRSASASRDKPRRREGGRRETEMNGDCLYAAVNISLDNPDGMQDDLRALVTEYALEHQDLMDDADLDADDVIETLSTPGAWAGDSGDLAPAFLATVIERDIVVITQDYVTTIQAAGRIAGVPLTLYLSGNHYTVNPPRSFRRPKKTYSVKLETGEGGKHY